MMFGQMTAGSWIYIVSQGMFRAPTKPSLRSVGSISAAIFQAAGY